MTENACETEGRYLYCVVGGNAEADFNQMGIEGSPVYTVQCNGISAAVHRCEAKPYQTSEAGRAEKWILAHQRIVDCAVKTFGTVIPMAFDTIFRGDDEAVRRWLREKCCSLRGLLAKLESRDEYGIQMFFEDDFFEAEMERDAEVQRLRTLAENASRGAAYLLEKRLERELKDKRAIILSELSKIYLSQIEGMADCVKIVPRSCELPGEWRGREMALSFTCLVHRDRVRDLGSLLGKIKAEGKFDVRFVGPWPPYSFVGKLESE